MMNTVVLAGGIGNQLFQLAAGYNNFNSFAVYLGNLHRYKTKREAILGNLVPKMEIYKGNWLFNFLIKSKITYKISFPFIIGEKNYLGSETFISGYFQDFPKNFKGIHDVIELVENYTELKQKILLEKYSIDQNLSLAIHIRLGDYLAEDKFWIFDRQYLERSTKRFENIKRIFIFCSDELPPNLLTALKRLNKDLIFTKNYHLSDYEEFILLSSFKYLIISNSTFSFWAGLINHGGIVKKVIAPSMYYQSPSLNSKWVENCKLANFYVIS